MITILATKFVPGYLPRFQQPCLLTKVTFKADPSPEEIKRIEGVLHVSLKESRSLLPKDIQTLAPPLLQAFVLGVQHGLNSAGFVTLSMGAIYELNALSEASLALPANWYGPQATQMVVEEVISLILAASTQPPVEHQSTDWKELLKPYMSQVPRGINSSRFLGAAKELDIPIRHMVDNVYQFGWGERSHWFDSSITDQTGAIATRLAKQKNYTSWVLKQAGLPTPEHKLVQSPEAASKAAQRIGYPVVIKPVNLDGGQGVTTDVRDEDELLQAYAQARQLSPGILVEKHYQGEDYRIHVYQDQAYWVAHRQAGGVIGDGKKTVEELLKDLNQDPRRSKPSALLKKITLDDEALLMLARQNLQADSIPESGRYVRLRRTANIASGGAPTPMLEQAHPDNLALAVRAARSLRLNIAGVDLLIPDITKSWQESGAVICEVNAQPQMSPGLHKELLEQIVDQAGRIPSLLILGDDQNSSWLDQCIAYTKNQPRSWGIYSGGNSYIGGQRSNGVAMSAYHAGLAMLSDSQLSTCIIHANDLSLNATGFPIDRFSGLILLAAPEKYQSDPSWKMLMQMAIEMTAGPIFAERKALELLGAIPRELATKIKTMDSALDLGVIQKLVEGSDEIKP